MGRKQPTSDSGKRKASRPGVPLDGSSAGVGGNGTNRTNHQLVEHFQCPEALGHFKLAGKLGPNRGYFRFGSEILCYGQASAGKVVRSPKSPLDDMAGRISLNGSVPSLPFDPSQVVENLRREQYELSLIPGRERLLSQEWVRKTYYFIRDVLPGPVRRSLQRAYFSDWKSRAFPAWPVDFTADLLQEKTLLLSMRAAGLRRAPFIWFWPEGAPGCIILTHDVETSAGRDFTPQLMNLDDAYGFKASFQVIPEKRYEVSDRFVQEIRNRGFEFNIHDLNHDGSLYRQRAEFLRRAKQINRYVHHYQARGFRAGSMYRIQDWYDAYEFSYDMSVPNVAHLEPKRGGCCTVFPYFVGNVLELPLTTCQDYSVFHILGDYSLEVWRRQIEMIRRRNGLISVLAHPDYLHGKRERAAYEALLAYLRNQADAEDLWTALPGDVDQWWRARSQMHLVARGDEWAIEGPQSDRARLAYAVQDGDGLKFELAECPARRNLAGVSPRGRHCHNPVQ